MVIYDWIQRNINEIWHFFQNIENCLARLIPTHFRVHCLYGATRLANFGDFDLFLCQCDLSHLPHVSKRHKNQTDGVQYRPPSFSRPSSRSDEPEGAFGLTLITMTHLHLIVQSFIQNQHIITRIHCTILCGWPFRRFTYSCCKM